MNKIASSLLTLLLLSHAVSVYAADRKTLADIEDEQDLSLLDSIPAADKRGNAIFEYRKYLQVSKKSSYQRRQVMVRLAELELERSEVLLEKENVSDQEMSESAASSIALFEAALKDYPDNKDNDRLLYQLARAYDLNSKIDEQIYTLERLVKSHPKSAYFVESQFRLGERYFVLQEYKKAYQAYSGVLTSESDFADNARYKRGWASFKLTKYQRALDDFVSVLDENGFGSDKKLSRIERELYDDTLRVISLSFSYLKGVKSVNQMFAKRKAGPYIRDIYYSLGQLYLKQNRYADTAATYVAYADHYPDSHHAPYMMKETIEVWQKSKIPNKVLNARVDFTRRYLLRSAYWQKNKLDAFPVITKAVRVNVKLLAEYYHSLGQKKKSSKLKQQAVNWYAEYIQSWPQDTNTPHMHFLYAELLNELGQLEKAYVEYDLAAYQYGIGKDSAEAAYASILVAKRIVRQVAKAESRKAASTKKKKPVNKSAEKTDLKTPSQKTVWENRVVKTTIHFAESFPNDKRVPDTLLHVAEIQYASGKMLDAIAMVEKVLPAANKVQKRKALLIMGHGQFELELYAEAEKNYLKLLKVLPGKDKERIKIRKRIAISIYKQGEAARDSGDIELAVSSFLRIKKVVPESPVVISAEYDAATELMKIKEYKRAIPVLKNFRKKYKKHKWQNNVTEKLALAYTETKQYASAAGEFALMIKFTKDKEKKRVAYFQIAEFYEKANKKWKALESYQVYLKKYPHPFPIAMETRQKLVDLYGQVKNKDKQMYWRKQIIAADKKAGKARTERSIYLAAMASMSLADLEYKRYTWVKLKAPFKKNLKTKKTRMKKAINAYANVVKYKVADTTTEAVYKMGEIYNRFSKALIKSERPKGLNADEMEQYELLLEDQSFPFEEKAIEFYQSNVTRMKEKLYDKWITKSIDRLGQLFPGRYLRKEKQEAVIDAQ